MLPLAYLSLFLGAALLIHGLTQLFSWWLDRVPVLHDPTDSREIDIIADLSPYPFGVDEQCRCGAFQPRHWTKSHCWHCRAELPSARVDAQPTDEPTWPTGKDAA